MNGMQGVFGWRGRMGVVSPSSCERTAWEFYQFAPEGMALLIATLKISEINAAHVKKSLDALDDAVRLLADTGAQYIELGGTPLSTLSGLKGTNELIKRLTELVGVPVTTILGNVSEALRMFSAKKIVVATPAPNELNAGKKKYFEDEGFTVLNVKSLNILRNADIRNQTMHSAYEVAREAYLETPEAEAIFVSCGSWGGPPVIRALESDFNIPVLTINQVRLWAGMRALKIKERIEGYGKLWETL